MPSRNKKRPLGPSLEFLEPRVLYSADLLGGLLLPDAQESSSSVAESNLEDLPLLPASASNNSLTELVIVDGSHEELRALFESLQDRTPEQRPIETILLDPSDGVAEKLQQITEILSLYENLGAVHLLTHDSDSERQPGKEAFGLTELSRAIADDDIAIQARMVPDITTDLHHHWALDGNGTNATGTTDLVPQGSTGFTTGIQGDGLQLDGDGATAFRATVDFDFGTATNEWTGLHARPFTVAFWINPSNLTQDAYVLGDYGSNPTGFEFLLRPGGTIEFNGNTSSSNNQVISTATLAQNTWTLVSATRQGNEWQLNLTDTNGVTSTTSFTAALFQEWITGQEDLTVGADHNGNREFDGIIDEIRIYERVLDPADIQHLALAPPTSPVVPANLTLSEVTDFTTLPDVLTTPLDVIISQVDGMAHGDLDGDGDQDIVITSSGNSEINIAWNDGNGSFSMQLLGTPAALVNPQIVDYNNDGDLDIVAAAHTFFGLDAIVYMNDGSGVFTAQAIQSAASNTADVDFAHITGDTQPDLLLSESGSNSVTYLTQLPSGDFTSVAIQISSTTGSAFSGASELASGDADGDGDIDFFVALPGSGEIVFYQSSAVSGAESQTLLPADTSIHELELADLNGDGLLDILWGGTDLVWMERDASGNYTSHTIDSGLGTNWNLTIFDQDGDGNQDIVTVDETSGNVTIYRNNGVGAFGEVPVNSTLNSPGIVDFVDIDGDGNHELLLVDQTGDRIEVARDVAPGEYVRLVTTNSSPVAIPAVTGENSQIPPGNLQVTVSSNFGWVSFANSSGLTFSTGSATADTAKVFTGSFADANTALSSMTFTPFAGFTGFADVTVTFHDTSSGLTMPTSASETFAIEVLANSQPLISPATLADIPEDTIGAPGADIASLFDSGFSDPDAGAFLAGVMVWDDSTGASSGVTGTWQFSADNGSTWRNVTFISGNAQVFERNTLLRFEPAADFSGIAPALAVMGLDNTFTGQVSTSSIEAFASLSIPPDAASIAATTLETNVTPVNDDPVAVDDTAIVQEGGSVVIDVLANDFDIEGDALFALSFVSPATGSIVQQANGIFLYTHDGSNSAVDTFAYFVSDDPGFSTAETGNVTIAITPVNEAPTIQSAALTGIPEDSTNPPGKTVNTLFGGNFTDGDSGAQFSGIAISSNTANASTEGSWQYSTDGGATWFDVGSITTPGALVLSPTDSLRFLPVANYNGIPPNLFLHGLDNTYTGLFTSGAARQFITDVSINGGSTAISDTAVFLSTAVNPVNDPPIAMVDTFVVTEGGPLIGNVSVNDSDIDGDSLTATLLTSPQFGTIAFQPNGLFIYTHDGSNSGTESFIYRQTDSAGAFTDIFVNILITPVNDAPVVQSASLSGIPEDSTNPPGNTVSTLFGSNSVDNDPGAQFAGIAISANTANPATEGNWQYSTDAGTTWFDVGNITAPGALVIANSDLLRFLPVANYNGVPPNLWLHGLDDTYAGLFTSGATRQLITDVLVNGGSTAISDAAVFLATGVNSVNDAPIVVTDSFTTFEGGSVTGDVSANDSDIDGDQLSASILTNPTSGTVTLLPDGTFTYLHDGSSSLLDSFIYRQSDSTGAFADSIVMISITAVNDAPVIQSAALSAIPEDSANPPGDTIGTLFGGSFVDSDPGAQFSGIAISANTANATTEGSWQYSTDAGATWFNVGNITAPGALALSATDMLRFMPVANYNGLPADLLLHGLDDTYTGLFSSGATRQFINDVSINGGSTAISNTAVSLTSVVTAVNDSPVASHDNITVMEGGVISGDVSNNDIDIDDSSLVFSVLSAPANGTVTMTGNGLFTYSHDSSNTLTDSFSYTVTDSQGATDTAIVLIDIISVNDPATISLANPVTQIAENTLPGSGIKVADIVVTDDGLGTNQLTLSGSDAGMFQLIGTELYLAAGAVLDFENQPLLNVTVNVEDASLGTGINDSTAFQLQVTDSNEPPGVTLANQVTTLAENTATSAPIAVADVVITDDLPGTNQLQLSGADAAMFQIVGNELQLIAGAILDFESQSTLTVTVDIEDPTLNTGINDSVTHNLQISNINEPATITLTNTLASLSESTIVSSAIKVADIAIADDTVGTNNLVLSGTNASLFQITGDELYLAAGFVPDFETLAQIDVTVSVDDAQIGTGSEDSQNYTLQILDANEPPAISLLNTITSLPESIDTSVPIKIADIVVSDDALGNNVLSLAGSDAADFQIIGNQLWLAQDTVLDFETNAQLDLAIAVDDASIGTSVDAVVNHTVAIVDSNEPPVVWLINTLTALPEDTDVSNPVRVADIVITDDAIGSNQLILNGTDATLFEISGNGLFLVAGAVLDFETLAQLSVNVSVDDPQIGTGVESTTTHTLDILDSNEPPAVWLINILPSLPENANTTSPVKVADIVVVDDALGTNNLQLTGLDAGLFQIAGNELFLVAGAALDHETQNTLSFSITVDDPAIGTTIEDSDSAAIGVTEFNAAPMLLSIEPLAAEYVENDVPVAITETLLALAPQSGILSSATIAITGGFQPGQDELLINNALLANPPGSATPGTSPLVADYDANTGVLSITGQATTADYLQWLHGVEYLNTSEDPASDLRTVEITVVDASLTSNVVQRDITVVPVNDLPAPVNISTITVAAGESTGLITSDLLSIDADHSEQEIIYAVIEPPAGIEILLNGVAVSMFSQSDIDAGRVSFIHDGSDNSGGNLFLEVTDGSSGMTGITIPITVTPAAPTVEVPTVEVPTVEVPTVEVPTIEVPTVEVPTAEIPPTEIPPVETPPVEVPPVAAALPDIEPVSQPVNPIAPERPEPAVFVSNNIITIDNILQEIGVAGEEAMTDTLTASMESEDSALITITEETEEEAMVQPATDSMIPTDIVEGEFGLIASLQLPALPFRVELFQQSPLVNELANRLFDRPNTDELTVEYRNQVLASLLELNPVRVAVNSQEWIQWQSENGGFERSLEVLDEAFKEAAAEIEQEGVVPELVIGTSIGLTTGFLVWLLRGGTLLASLMSVAPVWKQLDPLPILTSDLSGSASEDDNDEVESLFSDRNK